MSDKKKIKKTKKVSLPPKAKPQKPRLKVPEFNYPTKIRYTSDNTELSFKEKLPVTIRRNEAVYVYVWTKCSEKGGKLGLEVPMPKKDVEGVIKLARFGNVELFYETEKTDQND